MKLTIIILCTPALILVLAFIAMVIHGIFHPYRPSRDDVRKILMRVTDGTMTWPEWDNFTHIPIKYDPFLETIRRECEEMETGDYIRRNDPAMEEKWVYNEKGLLKVQAMIKRIEESIEQAGGVYGLSEAAKPSTHP